MPNLILFLIYLFSRTKEFLINHNNVTDKAGVYSTVCTIIGFIILIIETSQGQYNPDTGIWANINLNLVVFGVFLTLHGWIGMLLYLLLEDSIDFLRRDFNNWKSKRGKTI